MPNLSYHRTTWINDKRHSWTNWEFGNSNYAVDGFGDYEKSMQKCALLDNYFVETPIWMVDLTEVVAIHGVIIVSWPQHYSQNHIQRLTVAFDKNSKFITQNTTQSFSESLKICGHISIEQLRNNSRIHINCETHAIGRYVYIIAFGGDKYSRLLFSAILCEVYVYWIFFTKTKLKCPQSLVNNLSANKHFNEWDINRMIYKWMVCITSRQMRF